MYCSNCGTQLPDDANFCHSCGNKIRVIEPRKEVQPEVKTPETNKSELEWLGKGLREKVTKIDLVIFLIWVIIQRIKING